MKGFIDKLFSREEYKKERNRLYNSSKSLTLQKRDVESIVTLGRYTYLKAEQIYQALLMFQNLAKVLPVSDNDFLEYISTKEDALMHREVGQEHYWKASDLDKTRWSIVEEKLVNTTKIDLQRKMHTMDKKTLSEYQQYGLKVVREAAEMTLVDRAKRKHEKNNVAMQWDMAATTLKTDITTNE